MSTLRINLLNRLLKALPLNSQRIEQTRRMMAAARYLPLPRGTTGRRVDVDGIAGEMLYPKRQQYQRYFLYLHGGAFALGGLASHRALVARIADWGYAQGLLIDYRKAPEHPYPAALEDAQKAYQWLLNQGIEAADIALVGDSAGGGLTISLLQKLKAEERPLPAAAALICPWVDLGCTGLSWESNGGQHPMLRKEHLLQFARLYAGDLDLEDPRVSPLYGDLSGLPKLLVQAGGNDPLRDDATRLVQAIQDAGGSANLEIWPDAFHDWHLMAPILPDGDWASRRIGQHVRIYAAKGKRIEA